MNYEFVSFVLVFIAMIFAFLNKFDKAAYFMAFAIWIAM